MNVLGHTGAEVLLPPMPTPPVTDWKFEQIWFSALLKMNVVPEPSERTTTVIGRFANVWPGLLAAIAGSSQFVIVPVKMPQRAAVESCRVVPVKPVFVALNGIAIGRLIVGMTVAGPYVARAVWPLESGTVL